MKAICVQPDQSVAVRDVPTPEKPPRRHLVVKMAACAINPGDKTFLRRPLPPTVPRSLHDVWGVSGAGSVVAVGADVPPSYLGKQVTVYRSLVRSEHLVGTWSEYAQLPVLACCVLPDGVDARDYSGSLVNAITPYAFWRQAQSEGHRGVLVTAGNSATGLAMLGLALARDVPIVLLARNEAGRARLAALGAPVVLVPGTENFDAELQEAAQRLGATAVFDGVGGEIVNRLAPLLPRGVTVYSYGRLGQEASFILPGELLMAKAMTLKSFSNFASATVQNASALEAALGELSSLVAKPHFQTQRGPSFQLEEVNEALACADDGGKKPILNPW